MPLLAIDGQLVIRGGALVHVSGDPADCGCCDGGGGEDCAGCSGLLPLPIQLEFDTTAVTDNPPFNETCSDEGCQAAGGTYELSYTTEGDIFPSEVPACYAAQSVAGPGAGLPCTSPDLGTEPTTWDLAIAKDIYGTFVAVNNWVLVVRLKYAAGAGVYFWFRDLGATEPVCSSIFPMTLDEDDYLHLEVGGVELYPCLMFLGEITLSVP